MKLFEQYPNSQSLSKEEFEELSKNLGELESKLEFEGRFTRNEKIVAFREMENFVFGERIGNLDSRKAFTISHRLFFMLFRTSIGIENPSSTNSFFLFKTENVFLWKATITCDKDDNDKYCQTISRLNEFSLKEKRDLVLQILKPSGWIQRFQKGDVYELLPISRLSNQPYLFYSEKINEEEYTFHFFVEHKIS